MRKLDDGFGSTDIFESPSQWVGLQNVDPATMQPHGDRCVIREVRESERIGSLFVPEMARDKKAGLREGIVVAVGRGDKCFEKFDRKTQQVIRKPFGPCEACGGSGEREHPDCTCQDDDFGCLVYEWIVNPDLRVCPQCHGDGMKRFPMEVKVGDRVLVDRRRDEEFYFGSERYFLVHEQQAVMCILDSATVVQTGQTR